MHSFELIWLDDEYKRTHVGRMAKSAPKLIVVDSSDQRLARDLRSSRLVMIVFHREECPHCIQLFGLLPSCTGELEGMLKVIRADIAQCLRSAAYNKVRVTPTALLVEDGIVVERIEGAISKAKLLTSLNKVFRAE